VAKKENEGEDIMTKEEFQRKRTERMERKKYSNLFDHFQQTQ
jgi:uncharacterized short protein YbdD (DUF466 family)